MSNSEDGPLPHANATGPTPTPYFAAPDHLPASLPTDGEILSSTNVLKSESGRRIVRVGQHYVVKYGVHVSLTEGENMLFVRKACGIPVPRVYALYTKARPGGGEDAYIVMEYIDGEPLTSCWGTMSNKTRSDIARKMRHILAKMRDIPSPGYFGCIGRRPIEQGMFWSPDADVSEESEAPSDGATDGPIDGPFDTEEQFTRAMIRKYLLIGTLPHKARFYSHALPRVLVNHPSIFTHGDLQRKNILIRTDGQPVLIDWEYAAWYPSYWEYAMAMIAEGGWRDDWHEYVADMLEEQFPNEYLWLDMLVRELWS